MPYTTTYAHILLLRYKNLKRGNSTHMAQSKTASHIPVSKAPAMQQHIGKKHFTPRSKVAYERQYLHVLKVPQKRYYQTWLAES